MCHVHYNQCRARTPVPRRFAPANRWDTVPTRLGRPLRIGRGGDVSILSPFGVGSSSRAVSQCFSRNHVNPLQCRHGFVHY